jgi:hypothetical protein
MTYAAQIRDEVVIIPNVIGMDLKNALDVLDKTGLPLDQVYYESSDAKEEIVIRQHPNAGEIVAKNSPVILIAAKRSAPPTWPYWGGAIVAALLLGGFWGWKSGKGKQKQKREWKKEPEVKLTIIADEGTQTFHLRESGQSGVGLQLKIIPDKGVQTLKIN